MKVLLVNGSPRNGLTQKVINSLNNQFNEDELNMRTSVLHRQMMNPHIQD